MTPAQEAKEYADAHGFEIEKIGGKYQVTHVVTNHTFVRSGYPAVLNEMHACLPMLEMTELTPEQVAHIDEFFDLTLSPEDTALETAMSDVRAAAFGLVRQPAAYGKFQPGWCALVGSRQYPRRDSRSEALKDVRRAFQGMGRNKPTAVVVHTSQFAGFV